MTLHYIECPLCAGRGYVDIDRECKRCEGLGEVLEQGGGQ